MHLLAVLNVLSSTPARAKRLAPRPDGPLTHFASPRGEKCRLVGSPREVLTLRRPISLTTCESSDGFEEGRRQSVPVSPHRLRSAARLLVFGFRLGIGGFLVVEVDV